MKFLEKVKNMFTEEVEEEVKPIKTEVRKVEIPAPTKQPVKEEIQSEPTRSVDVTEKKDEKFKFPVYFDDKDFDKLPTVSNVEKKEQSRKVEKPIVKAPPKETVRKEAYGGKNPAFSASVKEEKKIFKPTPIISPVYGVLDKNYSKDDITPKKRVIESRPQKELTIDDIRNKAFGTLEEDLETTLFGKTTPTFEPNQTEEDQLDLFDELEARVEEPRHKKETVTPSRSEKNRELELMNEVEDLEQIVINERPNLDSMLELATAEDLEFVNDNPIEQMEQKLGLEEEMTGNMIAEEMDKICSEPKDDRAELTESDLFSLIDSMYEKKEGEE